MGTVLAVCLANTKGSLKRNIHQATLSKDFGISGDCHAEKGSKRQVSLLALPHEMENINECAFNLVLWGDEITSVNEGDAIYINDVVLKISEIIEIGTSKTNPQDGERRLIYCSVSHGGILTQGDAYTIG